VPILDTSFEGVMTARSRIIPTRETGIEQLRQLEGLQVPKKAWNPCFYRSMISHLQETPNYNTHFNSSPPQLRVCAIIRAPNHCAQRPSTTPPLYTSCSILRPHACTLPGQVRFWVYTFGDETWTKYRPRCEIYRGHSDIITSYKQEKSSRIPPCTKPGTPIFRQTL
jgi:hypothetical protein